MSTERELFEEYLGLNALLCQWSDEQGRYVGEKGNYFSDMFDCWQARAAKVQVVTERMKLAGAMALTGWSASEICESQMGFQYLEDAETVFKAMLNKEGA